MFGIGGWKQVGATFDMKRQAAIREQLEQAGIEYQVKVQNRLKSGVLSGTDGLIGFPGFYCKKSMKPL